jgi:DNA helicase-2/ATP-dependent DNA helicase PcrA
MVSYDLFLKCVTPATGRDIESNSDQKSIVSSPVNRSIKVIAGPGSGKTTVIALRLMKLIFVDGIDPQEIVATTFTVKASKELKSRILSWGIAIRKEILPLLTGLGDFEERERVKRLNFDQIKIGTLDAIAQETLTDECRADQDPPIVIQDFIAKHFMVSEWFNHHDIQGGIVEELLKIGFNSFGLGTPDRPVVAGAVKHLMDFHNRMMENGIDPIQMKGDYPNLAAILSDYNEKLIGKKLLDFPALEQRFLSFVSTSESDHFFEKIKVLMVDEYQDTNLLQEKIYGQFVKRIVQKNGCFIVVGDDDQSIYRFRGSRVHLFSEIEHRFEKYGVKMETEYLSVNYRSTQNIVEFCNDYVGLDPIYQEVRAGDKPDMSVSREDGDNFPVFGIFRDKLSDLAKDIADIVHQFSYNGSYTFVDEDGEEYVFEKSPGGGPGDAVLLMSSTANKTYSDNPRPRLPEFLADELSHRHPQIIPFNPRGNRLCDDPDVVKLVGTLIWCIDPGYQLLSKIKLDKRASKTRDYWKTESEYYINHAPDYAGIRLKDIVHSWATGTSYPTPGKWTKNKVTVLDILYNLLPWFCNNRCNAESMVSTQAVFNAIASAAIIKGDELVIKFNKDNHRPVSTTVNEFYRLVIRPLLEDSLEIDETLFFSISSDHRFNIMTIHQAKGLEFPITFVDVCSDFERNYVMQRLKRFPDKFDDTSLIERVMAKYCPDIVTDRSEIDMQFDDLTRKHFVAFSRAQDVLILVGLSQSLTNKELKNIALGYTRDGNWAWKGMDNLKIMR